MRLLLDTHVWLWLQTEPERLGDETLALMSLEGTRLFLSAASSWEIAIKFSIGKLSLPEPPASFVPRAMHRAGTFGLPVEHTHALAVAGLPLHHRDPFDRLIVAQARAESMRVVTVDPAFDAYDVDLLPL